MKKLFSKISIAALMAMPLFGVIPLAATADSNNVNFESSVYSTGTINGQDGWTSTGAAGSGCAVYDHAVDSSLGTTGFGSQSLRISNAVTSGCFGDQTFAKPLVNAAGEASSTDGSFSRGTLQPHFEAQFQIASTKPSQQQPGLFVSVSPDRGDGSRMSYLGFSDEATGTDVTFYDVQGTSSPANFVPTDLGILDRSLPHTIKFVMDFVDGPSNDVVKIYIDGNLVHNGTSWENYYRYDSEAAGEQSPRIVKTLLFRTGGTAAPATLGNGFLFDNLSLSSSATPSNTTVVVTPSNMQGWAFVNDQNDTPETGVFVNGPSGQPLGTGSAQLTASTTSDGHILALVDYQGKKFADLTTLTYATYQDSANLGNAQAIALQFNVDKDVTDSDNSFQGRIIFEPYLNNGGTVPLGSWNTWDALNSGNGKWWLSHSSTQFSNNCSQASPCTMIQLLSLYPNLGIHPTLGAVVLKAGSGWTSFKGNTDALTIGINNINTTYDFDPNPVPTTVKVTIDKFIDGAQATATTANNSAFPMSATWNATNIGAGTGSYDLDADGFNGNPTPYQAITADMTVGADYSTYEVTGGSVVGADCTTGQPYALVGYKSGDDLTSAEAATLSTTTPSFTNLTSDKVILVLNKMCLPTPVITTPANNTFTTTAGQTLVDWTDVTDPAGGITYTYQASNASTTNSDGSFVSTIYSQSGLSASQIPTPGTPEGVYYLQVKATDADGNSSSWTPTVKVTVDDTDPTITITTPVNGTVYPPTPAVNADYTCADALSDIASCVGDAANGSPIDMWVGTHSFTVTATDNSGNVTTKVVNYIVSSPVVVVPIFKDQCMNNTWKTHIDSHGNHFKNQGDCVSFVATKRKNLAAGN